MNGLMLNVLQFTKLVSDLCYFKAFMNMHWFLLSSWMFFLGGGYIFSKFNVWCQAFALALTDWFYKFQDAIVSILFAEKSSNILYNTMRAKI